MEKDNNPKKTDIYKANEILEKDLASIRTINDWADEMGYKTKVFAHHYRKAFGLTCKKEMVRIRLQRARDLIGTRTDLKYYQIADMVGLADEYALNKYFMRHTGNPPSYFRKNGQKKRTEKTGNKTF